MHTNHRRKNPRRFRDWHSGIGWGESVKLVTGEGFSAGIGSNDFTCGQHGYARIRRGVKKAINRQIRIANQEYIRQVLTQDEV